MKSSPFPNILIHRLLLATVVTLGASCTPVTVANEAPSYADAMQQHRPLATIKGAPQPFPASTDEDDRFASAIEAARASQSYNLLIWQGGKLRVARYFQPYDAELRPESASMHKSVMALAVMAAVDDGIIAGVDEPVGKYIPEWADDERGAITIGEVLTMSTGLKTPPFAEFNNGSRARAALLAMQPASPPGRHFQYANANSQIMVLVLEKATGEPYAQYLSRRVWKRLHAADAYVWLNEQDGFPRGYSALMARAIDWLRVGLLIKDRGLVGDDRIITAGSVDAMTAPSATNPNYGYQVWLGNDWESERFYNDERIGASVIASEPFAVDDMIYFDGFGGQRVYISRSRDLVIVRQGEMRIDWDDAILPNLVINAL